MSRRFFSVSPVFQGSSGFQGYCGRTSPLLYKPTQVPVQANTLKTVLCRISTIIRNEENASIRCDSIVRLLCAGITIHDAVVWNQHGMNTQSFWFLASDHSRSRAGSQILVRVLQAKANESPWRSYFASSWPIIARSYLQLSSLKNRTFRIEKRGGGVVTSTSSPQQRDWLQHPEAVSRLRQLENPALGKPCLQSSRRELWLRRRMKMLFTALTDRRSSLFSSGLLP